MASLSGTVPVNAKYVQGGLPLGLDSKRRTIKLLPQTGVSNYTPTGTNVIRIDIPPSIGFLDTQNSYLRFRIKIDNKSINVKYPCYMDRNAMSWCDRFEVISNNGSVLESIHDYNLLVNLLHKSTSPDDYRLTTGKLLDNQGSRAERMANLSSKRGRMYCCGLDASGIFGGNTKYLPCQFIQGALTLEFTLAQFADCFVGQANTGESATYTLDNVEYVAECISFGQDYNYLFEQQLRQNGIDIAFHSYRSHHHSLQAGNDQVIQLAQNSKSVKGVYCVMRDLQRYRSSYFESLSEYKSGRVEQYQFDLGGRLFPEFPVDLKETGESSSYALNLNSYNHFRDHNGGSAITRETFAPFGIVGGQNKPDDSIYANLSEVTARFHGFMIGNTDGDNVKLFGEAGAAAGALGYDMLSADGIAAGQGFLSTSIFFRPSSLFDLKDIKLGDRMKVCFLTDNADAGFDDQAGTIAGGNYTGKLGYEEKKDYTAADGAKKANKVNEANSEGSSHAYMFVVGVGLDVQRRYLSAAGGKINIETIRGCVALAKTRDGINERGAINKGSLMAVEIDGLVKAYSHTTDAKTPMAALYNDAENNLCYLDRVPDDKDFYIGQSFETHEEHAAMISGTDMTQTVPLHINIKFGVTSNTSGHPNAPVKQGDLLSAFIHYDAVLRIDPSGEVVSSM